MQLSALVFASFISFVIVTLYNENVNYKLHIINETSEHLGHTRVKSIKYFGNITCELRGGGILIKDSDIQSLTSRHLYDVLYEPSGSSSEDHTRHLKYRGKFLDMIYTEKGLFVIINSTGGSYTSREGNKVFPELINPKLITSHGDYLIIANGSYVNIYSISELQPIPISTNHIGTSNVYSMCVSRDVIYIASDYYMVYIEKFQSTHPEVGVWYTAGYSSSITCYEDLLFRVNKGGWISVSKGMGFILFSIYPPLTLYSSIKQLTVNNNTLYVLSSSNNLYKYSFNTSV
jgi:hypothetical protein